MLTAHHLPNMWRDRITGQACTIEVQLEDTFATPIYLVRFGHHDGGPVTAFRDPTQLDMRVYVLDPTVFPHLEVVR